MSETITIRTDDAPVILNIVGPGAALALDAAARAENARDGAEIAAAAVGVFPDTGAGLAATTSGQSFYVASGGVVRLYLNNAGVAVEQAQLVSPASPLFTDRPTSAALAASDGSIFGYSQGGPGAIQISVKAALDNTIYASAFGVLADGSDETAKLQNAVNRAAGGVLRLPAGTIVSSGVSIPSHTHIIGEGMGRTILKLKDATNDYFLRNSDGAGGNTDIRLEGFTVDGNYLNQTSPASGVLMDKVTFSYFDLEVRNCNGMGLVLSEGGDNNFGPSSYYHANGLATAGYGVYVFCSSRNTFFGGRYSNNCIGIAIEASGAGLRADFNRVVGAFCDQNRADFSQSGAGVHFETSSGGGAIGNEVVGGISANNTGVGINNTETAVKIIGAIIRDNGSAGIATLNAHNFQYIGNTVSNNGATATAGYRSEIIFDAPGYASEGLVAHNYLRGSYSVDGAIRTTQPGSAIKFLDNDVLGYPSPYVISGAGDVLSREEKGSFTATMTGGGGGITAVVDWRVNGDTVTLEFKTGLSGSSSGGTTCGFSGAPTVIYPASAQLCPVAVIDNSAQVLGLASIATNAVGTLFVGAAGAFNGAGNKGLPAGTQISYRLY